MPTKTEEITIHCDINRCKDCGRHHVSCHCDKEEEVREVGEEWNFEEWKR